MQDPPQTYATVSLADEKTNIACSFSGSDSVICAVTGEHWSSVATIKETFTMKTLHHFGLSSNKTFTAGLKSADDGTPFYVFSCTKPEGGFDVLIRFVEYH